MDNMHLYNLISYRFKHIRPTFSQPIHKFSKLYLLKSPFIFLKIFLKDKSELSFIMEDILEHLAN